MSHRINFDAKHIARGWLAVALASGKDDGRPQLCRTVHIEAFTDGARLVASDGYVLLNSWVPALGKDFDAEPGADDAPLVTATAIDIDGRGANLLAYLLKLATAKDAPEVTCSLALGVELDTPPGDNMSLDGLAGTYVVIDHPDAERVCLPVHDGAFPNWRQLITNYKAAKADTIALNPEIVGRLSKMGKLFANAPLVWHFGGAQKMALVEVIAEPTVSGAVMPVAIRNGGTEDAE